jgi:hypothetical protein
MTKSRSLYFFDPILKRYGLLRSRQWLAVCLQVGHPICRDLPDPRKAACGSGISRLKPRNSPRKPAHAASSSDQATGEVSRFLLNLFSITNRSMILSSRPTCGQSLQLELPERPRNRTWFWAHAENRAVCAQHAGPQPRCAPGRPAPGFAAAGGQRWLVAVLTPDAYALWCGGRVLSRAMEEPAAVWSTRMTPLSSPRWKIACATRARVPGCPGAPTQDAPTSACRHG